MKTIFIAYPKCSTCRNAEKYLKAHAIDYEFRHITEAVPTADELRNWISQNDFPIRKLFNTSGNVYKQLNLKEKLDLMSEEEMLQLLASNGMLIKRPILIQGNRMINGYSAEKYDAFFSGQDFV
ncbi:MAG: arsenate reductase family protein [Erysipelotrichaceae bacterium]|nr:arsenate reductase family protein [Erysipelotrichaceae bacterium]